MGKSSEDQAPAFTRLETLTVVIVVGVLALALGLVALAMPTHKSQAKSVGYTQSGQFGYSGITQKDSPYGSSGLSAGEPILLNKVGPVTASFRYEFTSKAPAVVQGTAAMEAMVKLSQGLTRQFPIAAETSFSGTSTTLTGRLPLKAIQNYVASAQGAFGDNSYGTATVTLHPRVDLRGTLGSRALKASYSPSLPFTLSGTTLTVGQNATADPTAGGNASPLKPNKSGKTTYHATAPNTVPLLVVHPPVLLARAIGFGLAGVCLLLGLLLARPLLRSGEEHEGERIQTLYGAHLVEVRDLTLKDGPVAELSSIDSLADLAKKYESKIMHVRREGGDDYLVWDNGMLFRYRPARAEVVAAEAMDAPGVSMTKTKAKKLNGVAPQ